MRRWSREDWLALGLDQLGKAGPEGLTVQALCARAGRTRGSLYHHFDDHDALLDGIVEHWAALHTEALIHAVGPTGDTRHLDALARNLDVDVEVGIRRLSQRFPRLKPSVAAVDGQRVAFLTQLHRPRLRERAEAIAQIEYAAFLGFQQLEPRPDDGALAALFEAFDSLVVASIE